jgi:hypothetical protein
MMRTELGSRRSLFGRLAALATAKPDPTFTPPPVAIVDGLWAIERRTVVVLGLTLPCRSTLIRLRSGGLLVHSPPPLDDVARSALDVLGPVTAIVAPNSFHHTYVPDHARAFPKAQVFSAPGLAQRIPSLPPAVTLSEIPPEEWRGEIDQSVVGPDRGLSEVTFFHRPTKTVILTDFSMNLVHPHTRRQAVYWRLAGYRGSFGPSRLVRMTAFRDHRVAASYAAQVLEWDFDRIVMCHGEVVDRDARGVFRAAFSQYLDGSVR